MEGSELTLTIRLNVKLPNVPWRGREGAVPENLFSEKVRQLIHEQLGPEGVLPDGTRYVVESTEMDINY